MRVWRLSNTYMIYLFWIIFRIYFDLYRATFQPETIVIIISKNMEKTFPRLFLHERVGAPTSIQEYLSVKHLEHLHENNFSKSMFSILILLEKWTWAIKRTKKSDFPKKVHHLPCDVCFTVSKGGLVLNPETFRCNRFIWCEADCVSDELSFTPQVVAGGVCSISELLWCCLWSI